MLEEVYEEMHNVGENMVCMCHDRDIKGSMCPS